MDGNKTVIAILFSALLICATIYYVGKKPEKIPTVIVPESSQSQTASNAASPTAEVVTPTVDDLSIITTLVSQKSGIPLLNIKVTMGKRIGDYAIGGVTEKDAEVGGAQWWGAFTNGTWKIVHIGQDYPKCSAIVGYSFPKELLDSCWDDATNKLKTL